MTIELNRYKNLQRSDIDAAIKFIKGTLEPKDAPSWIKRFKKEDKNIKIQKNNLFIEGLMVVGNDERDTLMRSLVYDKGSIVAPSRDAGYYSIKKKYLNVSRRNWTDFLKKQRVIRMTDNAPPKQKKGGKQIHRLGEIEVDLVFISKDDISNFYQYTKAGSVLKSIPVVNMVDRLTSFAWCQVGTNKTAEDTKNIVEEGVLFFKKLLKIKQSQIHLFSDGGGEFFDLKYIPGVTHVVIKVGAKVEQKNSHVMRNFMRIKNAKRGNSVAGVLAQSVDMVNNSYNRILKMTPAEAVEKFTTPEGVQEIKDSYNKHRAKADTDRRKPLKVGDFVRLLVKKEKEHTFRKAYRGLTFTKEQFPVGDKNKNHPLKKKYSISKEAYEIKETKGNNPKMYHIFGVYKDKTHGVWFSRHQLSEPMPDKGVPDQKSEALLRSRKQSGALKKKKKPKPAPKPAPKVKPAQKKKPKPPKKKPEPEEEEDDDDDEEDVPKEHMHKNAFKNQILADNETDRAKGRLYRMLDRETATKHKFDELMKRFKILLGYFTWHAMHDIKLIKHESLKRKRQTQRLIVSLKKNVRIV